MFVKEVSVDYQGPFYSREMRADARGVGPAVGSHNGVECDMHCMRVQAHPRGGPLDRRRQAPWAHDSMSALACWTHTFAAWPTLLRVLRLRRWAEEGCILLAGLLHLRRPIRAKASRGRLSRKQHMVLLSRSRSSKATGLDRASQHDAMISGVNKVRVSYTHAGISHDAGGKTFERSLPFAGLYLRAQLGDNGKHMQLTCICDVGAGG